MSSDTPNPTQRPEPSVSGSADQTETTVLPPVPADEVTRPIPVVQPEAGRTAWDDPATRTRADNRLRPVIIAAVVGGLAAIGTVVAALVGVIQHSWGLWLLVVLAGVAGGCLAGALAGWFVERPMRALLKQYPWEPLSGHAGLRGQIVVIADNRRRAYDLELDRSESIGEIGSPLTVKSCGGRDEKVVEFGPKKRWRLAERVQVMLPDQRDLADVEDDDEWRPSGPVGEQPDADGLYAG